MAQANEQLRKEQDARRGDEPPTLEQMIKDLQEEAADPRTSAERRADLKALLALERATRPR